MRTGRSDGYALLIVLGLTLVISAMMALATSAAWHHRQMNRQALQNLQNRAATVQVK